MKVLAGRGDEDDTLRDRSIYVYDTAEFPFHAGELYHQYHNDMIENYGTFPQSCCCRIFPLVHMPCVWFQDPIAFMFTILGLRPNARAFADWFACTNCRQEV